jgi:hypothetical protein
MLKGQYRKIFYFRLFLESVSHLGFSNFLAPVSVTLAENLSPVSLTTAVLVANLPPLSLMHVVHLDMWISPRMLAKIWNDSIVIFRGLGEDDSWKKHEAKILRHRPFKACLGRDFFGVCYCMVILCSSCLRPRLYNHHWCNSYHSKHRHHNYCFPW